MSSPNINLHPGDVVEVHFPFPPNWIEKPHPVIVLSINAVQQAEGTFIGVPISHSGIYNENMYSFPLDNTCFEKDLLWGNSHVRMHLVTNLHVKDIVPNPPKLCNRMNQDAFLKLFDQIQELIFGCS